jgi:hypothetical protein
MLTETILGDPAARYILNRPPVSEIASESSLAAARVWLETCHREHTKCSKDKGVLPTRVLDVGTMSGNEKLRLRASAGEKGRYVALSYCWGSKKFVTLNQATLAAFEAEIDITTLPKTIHDAIQVTRSLGIPYLWVDSLCIVQDSPEDMEKELSKMSEIYMKASVTLSAASANDSSQTLIGRSKEVECALDKLHTLGFALHTGQSKFSQYTVDQWN